jgi:DNA-binding YbaB/EbfC family protein
MFKGLGNLANIGSLLKQAQQMGSRLQEVNQRLKEQRVSGSAGGGLVSVEVDGLGEAIACRIDPSLAATLSADDRELIEDLLPAAINQAVAKARTLQTEAMQSVAGGLDLSAMKHVMNLAGGAADAAAGPHGP